MTTIPSSSQSPAPPLALSQVAAALVDQRPPDNRPFGERLVSFLTRASVVAILASIVLHAIFLVVSGVIHFSGPSFGGGPQVTNEPVQVAITTQGELAALETSDISTLTPGVNDSMPDSAMAAVPNLEMPGGSGSTDIGDLGTVGAGLGGAGTGSGIGVGDGAGGSGGGSAKFFGVEAHGSHFVYIVDISGSMNDDHKLDSLKEELVSSITAMPESSSFLVLPFESDVVPLLRRDRWTDAAPKNKKEAFRAIRDLEARGGTNPNPAFREAFKITPHPDAIYFMTDGLFGDDVADQVAAMNRGTPKVPIYCFAFGDRSSEQMMQRMARESGGTYTFIKVGP